ncbi:hypothetical protein O9993_18020 [Vibrio lentus]|nr:hypothetical protein [Vibrio lentus]
MTLITLVLWATKSAFTLDEVITMTGSVDTVALKSCLFRINNVTEGALLYFLGTRQSFRLCDQWR